MAEISLVVVSTVLTGLFLIAVALLTRSRNWRDYTLPTAGEGDALDAIERGIRSPTTWFVLFLLLVVVFGGGAIMYVGGFSVSPAIQQSVGLALAGAFSVVLAVYLLLGIYVSARARGLKSAQAAGLASAIFGLLFLAAVTWKLIAAT